jgi:DNA modification methylase
VSERFLNDRVELHCGDCLDVLARLDECLLDSCVTDPPYHLTSIVQRFGAENAVPAQFGSDGRYARASAGFMGRKWDGGNIAFRPETWVAVYRVLKPGGYLLAMGGTRTYHRMACAIEDAGFEIRDTISWLYGSGFPKSHDVSKGIDRAAGAEREVVGRANGAASSNTESLGIFRAEYDATIPATDAARQWDGWGTALKPAHEDIVLAQKPLDLRWLANTLAHKLMEGICQLPSLASAAANDSPSSRSVFVEGFGSAQWNAVRACSIPAALFDLMATWPCESAIPSSLNTALSWLAILVEVSTRASTFTIETETGLITDLKTLQCLWSKTIADCIIGAATRQHGIEPNASIAEYIFSAVAIRLKITSALSAHAPALEKVAANSPDVGLSPDLELIVLARKPLSEGTVAANVLRWGTGAINVDGCRVEAAADYHDLQVIQGGNHRHDVGLTEKTRHAEFKPGTGRWPANVVHDGSDEVTAAFPDVHGAGSACEAKFPRAENVNVYGQANDRLCGLRHGDSGSAARFFYTAKADADDRLGSKHPTVKPLDLMQWLVRLVTPKGGTVLDPFSGTGTTGEAAWREGMRAVLIEAEPEYQADIRRRMALALAGPDERTRESIKARNLPRDDGPLFAQVNDYDGNDDFARSIDEAYRVIRERKANGGKGWGGWE